MQRLVYSPKTNVYVKTADGKIRDLSHYVVSGEVNRKINQVSTATVKLRNPNRIFTSLEERVFRPMDPITIFLTRLNNRPIRVFTGFLDEAPLYRLFPDDITLKASCTLKKILHTYFDPALPYTREWIRKRGWIPTESGFVHTSTNTAKDDGPKSKDKKEEETNGEAQASSNAPNTPDKRSPPQKEEDAKKNNELTDPQPADPSMGNLLHDLLLDIGGWRDSNIYIEKLPSTIVDTVVELYKNINEERSSDVKQELEDMLHDLIGEATFGDGGAAPAGGTGGGATATGEVRGVDKIIPTMVEISDKYNVPATMTVAVWQIEWPNLKDSPGNPHWGWFQMQRKDPPYGSDGTMGGKIPSIKQCHDLGIATSAFCSAAAARAKRKPGYRNNVHQWAQDVQGVNQGTINNPLYISGWPGAVERAKSLISKYGKGKSATASSTDEARTASLASAANTIGGSVVRHNKEPTEGSAKEMLYPPVHNVITDSHGWGPGHKGIDLMCHPSAQLYAVCKAKVVDARGGGWWGKGVTGDASRGDGIIRLKSLVDIGSLKKGMIIGYGHAESPMVKIGDTVEPGTPIAKAGFANGWHVHFFMGNGDARDGDFDPRPFWNAFRGGEAPSGGGVSGGGGGGASGAGGGGTGVSLEDAMTVATATQFATQLEWPSIEESTEAIMLMGNKSAMNDKSLFPFIEQVSSSAFREFQSMPNGNFYAFFPDKFGQYHHRTPYWAIDDIEVLDGTVYLNDDSLATHVYVTGNTSGTPFTGGVDWVDRIFSGGVMTVFEAFKAGGILNQDQTQNETPKAQLPKADDKDDKGKKDKKEEEEPKDPEVVAFLTRYGVRPVAEEQPMVNTPVYEAFLAYQRFLELWSTQFRSDFTFTFMPEVYPGGIVIFLNHGIQMYVEEVVHNFDYEAGFTTTASLSSPAVTDVGTAPAAGMVRALFTKQEAKQLVESRPNNV